ncbi:hypothetical protein SDRG_13223 [Saprolegnia diclina VS20]|uniref:Uncharacterized protein n=1 Tax=Saprolegnia diclina (strain VS20) TaxID=1156394 RepID=T0RA90_SAPDV|nr:hypothetical protein SDRG_13223 [Saprolegnia diclina VS20]EQC29068.1 hypothetical protein SDRG_13223 [Saprolegnia diclina VS20]|eukprot:XP_008617527.1 hypothetical protein SDRG_13223 [Saprolegnia diclina VS20]
MVKFVVTVFALVASTFAAAAAVDTPVMGVAAKLSTEAGQTPKNLREGDQKECFGSICGGFGFGWGLGGGCGLFSPFRCGGWF